jgi:hypothetical protein
MKTSEFAVFANNSNYLCSIWSNRSRLEFMIMYHYVRMIKNGVVI